MEHMNLPWVLDFFTKFPPQLGLHGVYILFYQKGTEYMK